MDLIEVLQQASRAEQPEAMTFYEIVRAMQWPEQKVRRMLREKVEDEEIEVVFVKRQNVARVWHTVPAYRIVSKE